MNIGEVATASGLPAKTIRYYEDIGLLRAARGANGYRHFDDRDVRMLSFVSRARSLGFSIDDCRSLLSLYADRDRASADVKRIAREHLTGIAKKITELEAMRDTLEDLVSRCQGDDHPDCPILDGLAGAEVPQ
ncbi:Cu(I)-responsive transcriptional regulator [Roseovarius sp. 217]|uniref:Cu(I)-responsive transcriptional regulator n=1 Tax=Roseovarius sp. (strain 217) TaxID=314264 RepID=UPI0000688040|nr:Cu(I)-responsive transcriptional regulator [Roseovarius sp. 217]EAQ23086.1 transcriptional regulator [Roseovarius sp. 217]